MKIISITNSGKLSVTYTELLIMVIGLTITSGCATTSKTEAKLQAHASEQARTEAFVLREGDVVKVSFPGSATLDTTQKIRRDGKIVMPLVGEVNAAGLTPETLQTNLSRLYEPQISSKLVIVSVEASSFPVFVTGSVVNPGKIVSDHPITALDAIMEAGGFEFNTANLKEVRVIRNENGVMRNYNLNLKLVLEGKHKEPFYLKPSDIVYVPQRFIFF